MTRHLALAAVAFVLAAAWPANAETTIDRHHYTVTGRVRPLVVFWITRTGIGDAVITRRGGAGEAYYSLLIGSDPDRAPLGVNRWGYIEEEIRGANSRLLGLMTESEEESVEEAEASVRTQAAGRHPFKIIEASADGSQARSRVRSIAAPSDYTFRQLPIVLDLARRDSAEGRSRVVTLPAGARPGFLCALADAMRDGSPKPIMYAYFGRLYELRRTRATEVPVVQVGRRSVGPAIAADFVTTSTYNGERTRFSITYATTGPLAGVPLRVVYQPRWWMQVELTIDDEPAASTATDGAQR